MAAPCAAQHFIQRGDSFKKVGSVQKERVGRFGNAQVAHRDTGDCSASGIESVNQRPPGPFVVSGGTFAVGVD